MLVGAMHITAAVWINDDEPGLHEDTLEWLDKVAPPSWKEPANDVARELLPDPGRLPPPPRRRGQRRRPPEEPARPPPGDRAGHGRPARPGPVAAGLLLRVRRRPAQADDHQGAWGVTLSCGMRLAAPGPASRLSTAMSAIRSRVACVAEPTCGTTSRFGRVEQRMIAGQRLGIGHVERGAGELARVQRARRARPCPRSGRARCSPGRRWASSGASASSSISPRVSGVSGQWMVTKSERSSSSSERTPPLRLVCSTSQPNPSSRRADRLPDPAVAHDPDGRAVQVAAQHQLGLPGAPLARAHERLALGQPPRDAEHQRDAPGPRSTR